MTTRILLLAAGVGACASGGPPLHTLAPDRLFERGLEAHEAGKWTEAIRAWKPEAGWHKYFCGECGSALYTLNPEDDSLIGMRMGSFYDDPGVRPAFHQFTAYAPAWAPVPDDGLPRFPERKPA